MTRSLRFPVLLGLAICQARLGLASSYKVVPVHLFLSAADSRSLLTIKNTSSETLRLQASVSAWEQDQDEMKLRPTEDIVLFPTVLSIEPGEERKLRVASATRFDPVEKTYRILFEELPPLATPETVPSQIRVLTRMSIPVFLQPERPVADARVEAMSDGAGVLSVALKNSGNVHLIVREVRARGTAGSGETVFLQKTKGWYVLAGGAHRYRIEIPPEECGKAKRVTLEVETDRKTLSDSLEAAAGACR